MQRDALVEALQVGETHRASFASKTHAPTRNTIKRAMQIRAEMKAKLVARSIPPVTPLIIVPRAGLLKLDRSTANIRFD